VALRLGGHAIAAGNFANFNAAIVGGIFHDQLVEHLAQDCADFLVAQAGFTLESSFSGGIVRLGGLSLHVGDWLGTVAGLEVHGGVFALGLGRFGLGRRGLSLFSFDSFRGRLLPGGFVLIWNGLAGDEEVKVAVFSGRGGGGFGGLGCGGGFLLRLPFKGVGGKKEANWASVTGSSAA